MELEELNRVFLEGHVKTNFACETSEDSQIFIKSEDDVKVLSFVTNMESDENKLKFDEYFIKCSDYHVADHTGITLVDIVYVLSRQNFFKLIMNEIFTPKFENTNIQIIRPLFASWSPKGFYRKTNCALAIISNSGNVDIFIKRGNEWISVTNLTKILVDSCKTDWKQMNINTLNVEEQSELHISRVLDCVATSICWSPIFTNNNNNCVYAAISYLSGCIRIWKISCFDCYNAEDFIQPSIVSTINISTKRIVTLHWCPVSNKEAWLVCGDLDGRVKMISMTLDESKVTVTNEVLLWDYEDFKANKICSLTVGSNSFILITKGQHLVISLIDNINFKLLKTEFINIGNYLITGIQQMNDNTFVLLTYSGVLKSVEIETNLTDIKYDVKVINTNIDWQPYGAQGLLRSPEGYLTGILVSPCKIFDHLSILKPTEIIFCVNKNLDPGKLLHENESRRIDKHWELLEVMRCLSIEKGALPTNWIFECETFDDLSLYELRIIYWMSLAGYKFLTAISEKYLPFYDKVTDPDQIEKIIYLKFYIERVKKLMGKHEEEKKLSSSELVSLFMMKCSIASTREEENIGEYLSGKYLTSIDDLIVKLNQFKDIDIPDCVVCDTPLVNGFCDHPDDRCMISCLQIDCDGKWHCRFCQGMAHEDIEEENPYCPLCDIPLLHYNPSLQ